MIQCFLGINGVSSCQNLRCQFPNGFSGYAMGRIASDTSLTYEELVDDHAPCFYETQEKLWAELKAVAEYTRLYAKCLLKKVEGDFEAAGKIFDEELSPMVNRYDMIDQSANDVFRINWVLGRVIKEGV